MKSLFEEMIGIAVPGDYAGSDEGIVRIGARRDLRLVDCRKGRKARWHNPTWLFAGVGRDGRTGGNEAWRRTDTSANAR